MDSIAFRDQMLSIFWGAYELVKEYLIVFQDPVGFTKTILLLRFRLQIDMKRKTRLCSGFTFRFGSFLIGLSAVNTDRHTPCKLDMVK